MPSLSSDRLLAKEGIKILNPLSSANLPCLSGQALICYYLTFCMHLIVHIQDRDAK
jgi:hypothetical protein